MLGLLTACGPADGATTAADADGAVLLPDDPPALVVNVVVDQLRPDQLHRYDEVFTGGFRRLLDEGLYFTEALFDHALTGTGPGHAVATTGVHPHRHGIVANSWRELDGDHWRSMYAVEDVSARVLTAPDEDGRSPDNLLRDGLPDWLKASDPNAQTVAISRKDRAAVAMGGRSSGHVYWLLPEHGRFVSSSFYMEALPDWAESFNERLSAEIAADTVWTSAVPEWARSLSRPDTSAYEGNGTHTYFPHRYHEQVADRGPESLNAWVAETPAPDRWALDLALEALEQLELGRRPGGTDYLALALSQLDRVGHQYGPLSREALDTLIRLDRELGRLFDALDARVGDGAWVLSLTSDHGVIEIPEHREEWVGQPGRRLSPDDEAHLVAVAEAAADRAGEDESERARAAAEAAKELDWVAAAYPYAQLEALAAADSFALFYLRSHYEGRTTGSIGHLGVEILREPGAYLGRYPTGTGHGTPYLHDRAVPVFLLGRGVEAGRVADRITVADLVPTLARLAAIPFPQDLDGRSLLQ